MIEYINAFGEKRIDYNRNDYLNAVKRFGSIEMAALHMGVHWETIRDNIPAGIYGKYLRKPPVISAEFNHYVMRAW